MSSVSILLLGALIHTASFAQLMDEVSAGKVVLKPNPLRNKRGQLCVSIFSSAEGFPADGNKAVLTRCATASELGDSGEFSLDFLPVGIYALAFFHDENSDGQLNTGAFGIPTEGFAFSNNPKIRFSAPKFAECVFTLFEGTQPLPLELRYFL